MYQCENIRANINIADSGNIDNFNSVL